MARVVIVCVLLCCCSSLTAGQCPELVGRWPYGETGSVAAEGNFVYFDRGAALTIADISVPSDPQVVGELTLSSGIKELAVDGGHAFILTHSVGLHIVDVTDATNPMEVSRLEIERHRSVAADGALVYVTSPGHRYYDPDILRVIDVSTPSAPVEVGSLQVPGSIRGIDASDRLVLLAVGFRGLRVIDVSVPTAPVEIGASYAPESADEVVIIGDLAVVAYGYDDGIRVIDVSSPSDPIEVSHLNFPSWSASHVAAWGSFAFVNGPGLLRVVDLDDPAAPVEVGSVETQTWGPVVVSGHGVFMASRHEGLRVINVIVPDTPVEVAVLDAPPEIERITVSGDFAFATAGMAGLVAMDVSNPSNLRQISLTQTPDYACDVEVSGGLAYVGDSSGLRLFDVATPSNPVLVGSFPFLHMAPQGPRLEVDGNRIFMILNANMLGRFVVVDVSVPTAPVELFRVRSSKDTIYDIEVLEGFAYVATMGGLRIFDVHSQPEPVEVGYFEREEWVYSVAVSGDHAYLHDQVLDVSVLSDPVSIGFYPSPSMFIELSEDGAFVIGAGDSGLRIIDVSVPSVPIEVGFHPLSGYASDLAVAGDLVFVPVGHAGFEIYDISGCSLARTPRRSGRRVSP